MILEVLATFYDAVKSSFDALGEVQIKTFYGYIGVLLALFIYVWGRIKSENYLLGKWFGVLELVTEVANDLILPSFDVRLHFVVNPSAPMSCLVLFEHSIHHDEHLYKIIKGCNECHLISIPADPRFDAGKSKILRHRIPTLSKFLFWPLRRSWSGLFHRVYKSDVKNGDLSTPEYEVCGRISLMNFLLAKPTMEVRFVRIDSKPEIVWEGFLTRASR